MSGSPMLSVLIPSLNRGRLLHDTVLQVLKQRFTDLELWVVDQSDPEQHAINAQFFAGVTDSRLHYVHLDRKGLPNARNEAIARATGKILLFLDDDVILIHDDFLDAHVRAYEDPRVGGVTGRIVERSVRPNTKTTASHISPGGRTMTNLWGIDRMEIPSLKGANMSYRAEAVHQVGGFDRNYIGTALLEDTDYSHRVRVAGWKLIFEPAAELVHLSALTGGVRVEDALRAERWRFRSTAYYVRKHRGVAGLVPFAVTFGGIALSRAVRWRSPAALRELARAGADGLRAFQDGADESIPGR
jgi:GT2 family glycosyltransferase